VIVKSNDEVADLLLKLLQGDDGPTLDEQWRRFQATTDTTLAVVREILAEQALAGMHPVHRVAFVESALWDTAPSHRMLAMGLALMMVREAERPS
jgi:hypothetical protein